MPIHAVLFDLGGTLLDTQDPIGWSEIGAALGIAVPPDHLAHAFREVEARNDRAGGPPPGDVFWAEVLSSVAGRSVEKSVGGTFLERWRASAFQPALFSDTRYCLETLQGEGIALGIVSNSESEARVRDHLKRTGIDRFFPVVVSSGTEGIRKPDPEIFRRGARRLAVTPGESCFVGDLAYTDAKAATVAGLRGIWLNRYGWGFGTDPPEVTSLTEVPSLVREFASRPR